MCVHTWTWLLWCGAVGVPSFRPSGRQSVCACVRACVCGFVHGSIRYTQKALRRGQDLPFRKLVPPVVPTDMEISSILDSKECCVRVFTVNGHSRVLPVASWTTASEVCRIIARSLGIRDRKCFRIYVDDPSAGEQVLDEDARILDVVAQLQFSASQVGWLYLTWEVQHLSLIHI